jgi:hypothetical protein
MGFITVDHSNAQQGRFLPPEGVYECMIASAVLNTTNGGTEYLKIKLTIRGDVPQAFPGETIEWPVWRKKEPTQLDPDGFPLGTIQHISRVVKLENGQIFDTFDDWTKAITGKPIRVEIKHDEYQGNVRAKVAYVFETEAPNVSLSALGFVAVATDEELPFN